MRGLLFVLPLLQCIKEGKTPDFNCINAIGHAWIADYGDPDKRDEFDYIYKYSPLHNIPDIQGKMDHGRAALLQYPSVLLTTGDHDDRVSPLHSLKFYAELTHQLKRLLYTHTAFITSVSNTWLFSQNLAGFFYIFFVWDFFIFKTLRISGSVVLLESAIEARNKSAFGN